MAKYGWRAGFAPKVKADIAARELKRIRLEHMGQLIPQDVVDAARPVNAPLHEAFTWNVRRASQKWLRHEARHLIRSVVVLRADRPPEPIFHHVQLVVEQRAVRFYQLDEVLVTREREYTAAFSEAQYALTAAIERVETLRRLGNRAGYPALDDSKIDLIVASLGTARTLMKELPAA